MIFLPLKQKRKTSRKQLQACSWFWLFYPTKKPAFIPYWFVAVAITLVPQGNYLNLFITWCSNLTPPIYVILALLNRIIPNSAVTGDYFVHCMKQWLTNSSIVWNITCHYNTVRVVRVQLLDWCSCKCFSISVTCGLHYIQKVTHLLSFLNMYT